MAGRIGARTYLHVDVSELSDTIETMRRALSTEQFNQFMYRTLKEVGNRAKTPIKRAVQEEYEVKQAWVGSAMGSPRMSIGDGVQCVIPLNGVRGTIGKEFHASGGHRGKKGQKLKLRARILKGQSSELPPKMDHQGGNPPFMAGSIAMTRKTKARYPLARVVGLGVPQMPMNQARPETEKAIKELAEKRLIHNFQHMFAK